MTEAEIFNVAIQNRTAYVNLGISLFVMSIFVVLSAYLIRNFPILIRGGFAALSVFGMFMTFMTYSGIQGGFYIMVNELSQMAADGTAPTMLSFAEASGFTVGDKVGPPAWGPLVIVAVALQALLFVYLYMFNNWETKSD